jgi:hypothetical protein
LHKRSDKKWQIRVGCYNYLNYNRWKNCRKKCRFLLKILLFLAKNIHKNVFQENRHFFRRKLVKIAENCGHNIEPRLWQFFSAGSLQHFQSELHRSKPFFTKIVPMQAMSQSTNNVYQVPILPKVTNIGYTIYILVTFLPIFSVSTSF